MGQQAWLQQALKCKFKDDVFRMRSVDEMIRLSNATEALETYDAVDCRVAITIALKRLIKSPPGTLSPRAKLGIQVAAGLTLTAAGTAIARPDVLRKGMNWLTGNKQEKKTVEAPAEEPIEQDAYRSLNTVTGVGVLVIAIISITAFFVLRGRA